jgi:hypothetical protein
VTPPSVVRSIRPLPPTMIPVLGLLKKTPLSSEVVPLFCGDQVAPPSVVRRIKP